MVTHSERSMSEPALRPPAVGSTVLLVSARPDVRPVLARSLRALRWTVQEAASGAESWLRQEEHPCNAVLLDEWLPDLTPHEFAQQFALHFPAVDLLSMDGRAFAGAVRSPRRNELLLALRELESLVPESLPAGAPVQAAQGGVVSQDGSSPPQLEADDVRTFKPDATRRQVLFALPDMVGDSPALRELGRLVKLAAPHTASILIQGETGSGKELVAQAVHRLSQRASKPFVTLNCAAIPEQLLEAELFGHTRGAFTGAVTSRTGRIEAANGGTLFLDEIGEMPLALQAKMLRFLECGEIQRIGDNETVRVDVRIVAATHQPLEQNAEAGRFRLDLYHRLAVFPVDVPPLRERMEDLPMLVQHLLDRLGAEMHHRTLASEAMQVLARHTWPGNVRELAHVLHRAMILSGDSARILPEHLMMRSRPN